MNEVKFFKLITGETIVGTVIKNSQGQVTLENVFTARDVVTQDGRAMCYFEPFILYSDTQVFTFNVEHIITVSGANKVAIEYYSKVTQMFKDALSNASVEDLDSAIFH